MGYPLDCLRLQLQNSFCPSVNPLSKNPGDAHDDYHLRLTSLVNSTPGVRHVMSWLHCCLSSAISTVMFNFLIHLIFHYLTPGLLWPTYYLPPAPLQYSHPCVLHDQTSLSLIHVQDSPPHIHTCQPQNFEKRERFLWVDFYLSIGSRNCLSLTCSAVGYPWRDTRITADRTCMHSKNRLK